MSSFKIFYLNDINRLQAIYRGVEANVEATEFCAHLASHASMRLAKFNQRMRATASFFKSGNRGTYEARL